MRVREPRWARFTRAAVGDPEPVRAKPLRIRLLLHLQDLRRRVADAHAGQAESELHRRADARLLPAVVGTWAAAAAAMMMPWELTAGCALVLVTALLVAFAATQWRRLSRMPTSRASRARNAGRVSRPSRARWAPRSGGALALLRAAAPTVILAAVCILGVLASAALRSWGAAASPIDQAVERGEVLVLTIEVETAPRRLSAGNGPPRVVFDAVVVQAQAKGKTMAGRLPIRVVAGTEWAGLQPGDSAVTAGSITPAGGHESVAGFLRPSTIPQSPTSASGGSQAAVTAIRSSWVAAVQTVWEENSDDTAGLLPGMVMGDRAGMDSSLDDSMKVVGLTHLTAVSGANCTLILASLMLGLRTLRSPRSLAFAASGLGLLGFVLVVGPDPSVLRAAVMGAIGAMAILGGRPKRVGTLLAVSIVVLLLADPWLAADYAFILSVLATLGLHLLGQRCVRWLAVMLPLWLAQAVAIPLAAQLFCAPVIVLLQARLTPYTIPANMLAAPVVALITTVGTLGMVVATVLPPLAALCAAISGFGAWWVAVVARTLSVWPAASLPWPSGVQGVVLMSLLNTAVLAVLFAVVEKERARAIAARMRALLPARWRGHGFVAAVVFATGAAAWWSAAVLQL